MLPGICGWKGFQPKACGSNNLEEVDVYMKNKKIIFLLSFLMSCLNLIPSPLCFAADELTANSPPIAPTVALDNTTAPNNNAAVAVNNATGTGVIDASGVPAGALTVATPATSTINSQQQIGTQTAAVTQTTVPQPVSGEALGQYLDAQHKIADQNTVADPLNASTPETMLSGIKAKATQLAADALFDAANENPALKDAGKWNELVDEALKRVATNMFMGSNSPYGTLPGSFGQMMLLGMRNNPPANVSSPLVPAVQPSPVANYLEAQLKNALMVWIYRQKNAAQMTGLLTWGAMVPQREVYTVTSDGRRFWYPLVSVISPGTTLPPAVDAYLQGHPLQSQCSSVDLFCASLLNGGTENASATLYAAQAMLAALANHPDLAGLDKWDDLVANARDIVSGGGATSGIDGVLQRMLGHPPVV